MTKEAESKSQFAGDLVRSIKSGSVAAEETLVRHYWKSLHFILNQRCQDTQLAADIAQDTLIVVISKARNGDINKPEALSGFIRQTGVNLLIAHYRKETRRATEAHGEVNFEIPDQTEDVLRTVESRQAVEFVRQLIGEMKMKRDRDILNSYFVKEETKQSICQRLAIKPEHFDRVLFRARGRLKQIIEFRLGGDYAS